MEEITTNKNHRIMRIIVYILIGLLSLTTFSYGETISNSGRSIWILQSRYADPRISRIGHFGDGNPFMDLDKDTYYYDAVCWANNKEITTGTTKKTFSPMDYCSRAQVVTFLWRTMGMSDSTNPNKTFDDIGDPNQYFYKAVNWAVDNKITKGTDSNNFSPFETVTRAQFVTFLWRTAGCPSVVTNNPFQDVSSEGSYYSVPVIWAVQNGITKGTDETHFAPEQPCNRAQVVSFLYRSDGALKGAVTGEEFTSYE